MRHVSKMPAKMLNSKLTRFPRVIGCIISTFIMINVLNIYYDIDLNFVPAHARNFLRFSDDHVLNDSILLEEDAEELKKQLDRKNFYDNEILNRKTHGPVDRDTPVIIIQVHKDASRLQYLIISLSEVHYIQTALLVFSHSFYDKEINDLVTSIRFCKVMQLFYPHSLQLHPNTFPGVDINDCISNYSKLQEDPNFFCIERDAGRTEHKQHWWWKANFLFENLEWATSHRAMVIFLEEHHYVSRDLLYVLRYAERALASFPEIHVISFGRAYTRGLDYDLLTLDTWRPPYDVGLAFNKTTWRKISALAMHYCMYDDSSWSYSMLNLFQKFPKGYADMLACLAPRVMSTRGFSSSSAGAKVIWRRFQSATLFPDNVRAVFLFGASGRVRHEVVPPTFGGGGWSDLRDQLFCLDPLLKSTARNGDDRDGTSTVTPKFNNVSIGELTTN